MDICFSCIHKGVCKYETNYSLLAKKLNEDVLAKMQNDDQFVGLEKTDFTIKISCAHYHNARVPFSKLF